MIAADEKHILVTSFWLMSLIIIPVIFLTFLFAWRYRASRNAQYSPHFAHSTILEIIWWTIPCIVIVILAIMTWTSSYRLDPYQDLPIANKKPITIEAIALQWKWLFIYPEQNIATINYIQFPVNVPIRFLITAEGPMNSFQIPSLAGQIYAMAGMQTQLHLIANEIGDYPGVSANFTGDGFSDMTFTARVSTPAQFDEWVRTVKKSSLKLSSMVFQQLLKPSKKNTVQYFSSANQNLFKNEMMKSMMPMGEV